MLRRIGIASSHKVAGHRSAVSEQDAADRVPRRGAAPCDDQPGAAQVIEVQGVVLAIATRSSWGEMTQIDGE